MGEVEMAQGCGDGWAADVEPLGEVGLVDLDAAAGLAQRADLQQCPDRGCRQVQVRDDTIGVDQRETLRADSHCAIPSSAAPGSSPQALDRLFSRLPGFLPLGPSLGPLGTHFFDCPPQVVQRREPHQVGQRGVLTDLAKYLVLFYPHVLLATVHRADELADPVRIRRVRLVDPAGPVEDDPVGHDLLQRLVDGGG
ncbi:hypothetical protein [Streptomyces sp. NPDC060187]|uniref:hypothetical protein n=1 Tax=Streptomyces sp. NPDC060187 TaxID=3347067 RepID=UPI003648642B